MWPRVHWVRPQHSLFWILLIRDQQVWTHHLLTTQFCGIAPLSLADLCADSGRLWSLCVSLMSFSNKDFWRQPDRWAASSNQTESLSGFVPSVVLNMNSLAGWRKRDKTSVCKNRIRAWSEKFLHDLHPDFSRAKQTQTVCWTLTHIQSSTYTLHTK